MLHRLIIGTLENDSGHRACNYTSWRFWTTDLHSIVLIIIVQVVQQYQRLSGAFKNITMTYTQLSELSYPYWNHNNIHVSPPHSFYLWIIHVVDFIKYDPFQIPDDIRSIIKHRPSIKDNKKNRFENASSGKRKMSTVCIVGNFQGAQILSFLHLTN